MGTAEGVRRPRHLDDDDLHHIWVVAIGVDDERRDRAQLVASAAVRSIGVGDRRQHHIPSLQEQRVEDLLLGGEVVVDEPVGNAGLVGDVRHAAGVESLPRKYANRRVEDQSALVGGGRHRPAAPAAEVGVPRS